MLVNYDFVRMYDIFDENIKSYIQTIKETDPKEFSPMTKDKVKILNIKTIQVNNQYRGQGHFKYMINQLENLCKKSDLYYKSVKLVMKS